MFFNREKELRILTDAYKKLNKKSIFYMIFGRRRVGKTELVKHFSKKFKSIYLFVEVKTERELLADLENASEKIIGIKPRFESWDNFFEFIFKQKGIILIFDEFQNFNKINPNFFSKLQKYWDEYQQKSKIFLMIIGSYVGLMKKIFMDKKEPLFGRTDFSTNLMPFDIFQTATFIKNFGINGIESILNIYSITDGIPRYLLYLDLYKAKNILELINHLFIDEPSPLGEEGKNILLMEFGSEHKGYFSILEAISNGKTIQNEIVQFTGLNKDTVAKYIYELLNYYEIIKREYPITEKPSARLSRYSLKDNFYQFWFRFIYKNKSLLESNKEEVKNIIKNEFNSHMGYVFENICLQILKKSDVFKFTKIGKWWYKANEIDIVAVNDNTKEILFAECKWKKEKIGMDVAASLMEKSKLVRWHANKRKGRFALFSKSGFKKECISYCKKNNILMFDLRDIEKTLNSKSLVR